MICTKSKLWVTGLANNDIESNDKTEEQVINKVERLLKQQSQQDTTSEQDVSGKVEEGKREEDKSEVQRKGNERKVDGNDNYPVDDSANGSEKNAAADGLKKTHGESADEKGENHCRSRTENDAYFDIPDDDYDTDIECEDDSLKSIVEEQKEKYINKCIRLGIPPATILLNSLTKTRLKMSHQGLGTKGMQAMAKTLKKNTSINIVELRDNCMDEAGIKILASILKENLYITDLDISENIMYDTGLVELIGALKSSKIIKHLKMSQTGLKDRHATVISDLIKENSHMKKLVLSKNELGSAAGVVIGDALALNNTISHLDLSWNHIRNEGAVSIGQSLKGNTSLTSLALAWNGFADKGTEAISRALSTNDSLEEMDLSYNRVCEKGAAAISDALKVNNDLKVLALNWNAVKSEGVTSLIEAINKNEKSNIEELSLKGVVINGVCKTQMDDLLIKKKALKIYYGGVTNSGAMSTNMSKIRREIVEIITKYLAKNRLRMLDLFNQWDKDKSLTLTRNEFRKGIKSCKIPITEMQLYFMLEWLDQDGNDEIEYNEFVAITEVE